MANHSFDAPKEQATPQPESQEIQSQGQDGSWTNNQGTENKADLSQSENNQLIQELLDLDKHEKFRWQGKEWTRDELEHSIMFQNQYTRKTQELAKQRDYVLNAPADYEKILRNPALVADFKKIYPKEYHEYAERMVELSKSYFQPNKQETSQEAQKQTNSQLPPEVVNRLDRIEQTLTQREQEVYEARVESYKKEVDQICDKLSVKYKFADVDAVLAGAQSISSEGRPLDEKSWDQLFKASNDFHQKRYESYQKELFDKQKTASGKAKDMGQGGGIAGQAPKSFRKMEDAREAMLAHIEANSRR